MRATRSTPAVTVQTIRYGRDDGQEADLHLPHARRLPIVCLLHGGFWRMPYGRDEFAPVARDLADRGYAVWNMEYRRLGASSGGWPATLNDVAAGVDYLATLASEGTDIDLGRVVVVGHSAGGHLALWSAARARPTSELRGPARVTPHAAAGLAAIVDLARAYADGAGRGAVGGLLAGSPNEQPARYAAASPIALLPLGVPQLIMHGSADDAVPIEAAREYVRAARAAGDAVQFSELDDAGHMDYLEPASLAHDTLCRWLAQVTGRA